MWDEFYGKRNAVNIGSSGDRTYHMLWHFQNGGLDGMKDCNPKAVVVMIGTNNRGIPELHGYDTAYGILALLKEIHAKLPEVEHSSSCRSSHAVTLPRIKAVSAMMRSTRSSTPTWTTKPFTGLISVMCSSTIKGNLKTDLMPDGLHPNRRGYRVWAKAMEPAIRKFLGEGQTG